MPLATDEYALHPIIPTDNAANSMLIDASGEKAAIIFRAPKTGNIAKVHFRLGTVTTGQTLKASLQDVDAATGAPDGTVDQSGTVAVADTDDNTWKTVTFGSARAVTFGDWIACVIEFDTTVGNLNIVRNSQTPLITIGYTALFTGTWALNSAYGILGVEYDDGSFGTDLSALPLVPTTVNVNTNSSPDEVGIKFSLPFPAKVAGVAYVLGPLANADMDVVLYDSDGTTALATASVDHSMSPDTVIRPRGALFSAPVTLQANVQYRATLKPTTVNNITFRYGAANASGWLAQVPGGTDFIMTQRTDAGAWTDTNTQRPYMALILSALEDGKGVRRHPGMTGGCPA